jgi:hypothetical protein
MENNKSLAELELTEKSMVFLENTLLNLDGFG